jgi:hypothetical protein
MSNTIERQKALSDQNALVNGLMPNSTNRLLLEN